MCSTPQVSHGALEETLCDSVIAPGQAASAGMNRSSPQSRAPPSDPGCSAAAYPGLDCKSRSCSATCVAHPPLQEPSTCSDPVVYGIRVRKSAHGSVRPARCLGRSSSVLSTSTKGRRTRPRFSASHTWRECWSLANQPSQPSALPRTAMKAFRANAKRSPTPTSGQTPLSHDKDSTKLSYASWIERNDRYAEQGDVFAEKDGSGRAPGRISEAPLNETTCQDPNTFEVANTAPRVDQPLDAVGLLFNEAKLPPAQNQSVTLPTRSLAPSRVQSNPSQLSRTNAQDERPKNYRLGCLHYRRNCKLRAECCGKFFTCRRCHDETSDHGPMDRFKTRTVACLVCGEKQPASAVCRNATCKVVFAKHYCHICKLYDDSEADIFHCEHCGICRRGRKEDTSHCFNCNACIRNDVGVTHNCHPGSFAASCPICMEDLSSSTTPALFARCGHAMHSSCFSEYTKRHYTCPLCKAPLFDMTERSEGIRQIVDATPMPSSVQPSFAKIRCNDCSKDSTVQFHFLELYKCGQKSCSSYNTVKI